MARGLTAGARNRGAAERWGAPRYAAPRGFDRLALALALAAPVLGLVALGLS